MNRKAPDAKKLREMILDLKTDENLLWHLRFNFQPSQPPEMFEVAKRAIKLAKAGKRFDTVMPGITADAVIEELRLDEFINA